MDPATAAIANAKVVNEDGDHIMQEKPKIGSGHYFPPNATLSDLNGIAKSELMIYVHSQKIELMESSNLDDLCDKSRKQICALVLKYAAITCLRLWKSERRTTNVHYILQHTEIYVRNKRN